MQPLSWQNIVTTRWLVLHCHRRCIVTEKGKKWDTRMIDNQEDNFKLVSWMLIGSVHPTVLRWIAQIRHGPKLWGSGKTPLPWLPERFWQFLDHGLRHQLIKTRSQRARSMIVYGWIALEAIEDYVPLCWGPEKVSSKTSSHPAWMQRLFNSVR